mmetsp:Transcript_52022/g.114156  ORF Transcript_52022/g.114156 Transcript_52022/m.114156 type:complete len:182 (+) Transcript_52022:40-585(+)|eukprot:CAMPEP_0204373368 /NCGR_PEP_ID=MMETSP0469-20131031/47978_1 /ASSEMBLY_ACC=CAM_ASM_000384 /TAXON_ID=2969 /ORGANISM="Oxyrrhis marina" /LENGTH=181 /DNA_ID=CAMNT_0051363815 /DNA_START=22 /DNA_END=567 /DNA_ORIENTATION=-
MSRSGLSAARQAVALLHTTGAAQGRKTVRRLRVENCQFMGVRTRQIHDPILELRHGKKRPQAHVLSEAWMNDSRLARFSQRELVEWRKLFDDHADDGKIGFNEFQKVAMQRVKGDIDPNALLDAWAVFDDKPDRSLDFVEFVLNMPAHMGDSANTDASGLACELSSRHQASTASATMQSTP